MLNRPRITITVFVAPQLIWLVTEWVGKMDKTKDSTCKNETGIVRMKRQWKADNWVGIQQTVYVVHLHVEMQINSFKLFPFFSWCRGGTHFWLCASCDEDCFDLKASGWLEWDRFGMPSLKRTYDQTRSSDTWCQQWLQWGQVSTTLSRSCRKNNN